MSHDPSIECVYNECEEYVAKDTNLGRISGFFTTYSENGFYVDFGYNKTKNSERIRQLQQNEWLSI